MHLKTFGLGHSRNNKKSLNIANIPNCELWIDLSLRDNVTFETGFNVSHVNDMSGKARHLTKLGAGNETVYPVYDESERGLSFSNMAFDQMISGAIGDWNFMHDGSGCSILILFKIAEDYHSNGALFSTSSPATSGIGTNLYYYNDSQRYRHTIRNGSSLALSSYGSTNSMKKGEDRILSLHTKLISGAVNDTVIRSNGANDFMGNNLSSFSNENSSGPLFFGKLATEGVFAPKFILKKCAIFSRRLTKREENMILNAWQKDTDIIITEYGKKDLAIIAGQSNATGRGLITGSGFDSESQVSNAQIYNRTNLTWDVLEAGINNQAFTNDHLGLEMNFAKTYTQNTQDTLHIVKHTVDSTSISQWTPGSSIFNNLQQDIKNAIQLIEDDGYVAHPIAFIWYQGESDAYNMADYTAYEDRLKLLIDGLNQINQFEQTPFVIVEIQQSPYQTGTTSIQNAGINISNMSPYHAYSHYIQTHDITNLHDANHIDGDSLNAIGARITQTILL